MTDSSGLWRKPQDPDSPTPDAAGLWQARNGSKATQEAQASEKGRAFLNSPSHEESPAKMPYNEYKPPTEQDITVANMAVGEAAERTEDKPALWKPSNKSENPPAAKSLWGSSKKDNSSNSPPREDVKNVSPPDPEDTEIDHDLPTTPKLPEKTVADKSGSNQGDRLPEKSGKPSNAKETSAKQELPEMDELDKASLEEPSPPSQKVKDTGDSKSGPEKTGKKDKESKKNKETEAVTEGNTSQEESSSELDPALRNISDQFQDIMKETPKSKKSDQVMEDFNGRSEEEQQEWVKDKLQGVQDAVEEEQSKQKKAKGPDPVLSDGKRKDGKKGGDGLATVDDVREGEAFRKAPQQVPTMAHKNWKGDKKNVVHQQSPPRTKVDNQISSDKTTTLQKNKKQSDNQEQGTGEQDSQASYLYPLAMLGKSVSILRHAPLFSALTLMCLGAGIEGTRQLGGLVIVLSQDQTTLSKRDSEPADVSAMESYILKLANGAGADSAVGVFLLHIWLALCIPFLACLCYLCVERASRAGTGEAPRGEEEKERKSWRESWWANPWSTLKTGLTTLKAGIYQGTSIIFLGSKYGGLSSFFQSSWYWPALRFTIFITNIIICILLLRQAISLAYMVITSSSIPFFTGPDTSATASTLATASTSFTSAQMFFILHIILAVVLPCLAVSWYALLNPHAKKQAQDGEDKGGDAEGLKNEVDDKDGSQVEKKRGWLSRLFCCGVLDKLGPPWVKWVAAVVVLLVLVPVLWVVTKGKSATGQASG